MLLASHLEVAGKFVHVPVWLVLDRKARSVGDAMQHARAKWRLATTLLCNNMLTASACGRSVLPDLRRILHGIELLLVTGRVYS